MKNLQQHSQAPHVDTPQEIQKKRRTPVYLLILVGMTLLFVIGYALINKEPVQSSADVAPAPLTQAKE